MKYEELQNCILPLECNLDKTKVVIQAYNRAGFLFSIDEEDFNADIDRLKDFSLKPKITTVKLYKYNYYDKARQETLKSFWTTQSFYEYFPNNNNFELRSTEIKTVEVEE